MKRKYFWNSKWFWISLLSVAAIGTAGFDTLTNQGQLFNDSTSVSSHFSDSTNLPDVNTLSGYGYHANRTVNYVPWVNDTPRKIIDVFPTFVIANRVLDALRTGDGIKFLPTATVSSTFLKTDLAKIRNLNLSDLNLTNIDEILNPAFVWTNLRRVDVSNNNFKNYVLKFEPTQMPKLYSIIARSANLNEMVDVSAYVTDPFDQAVPDSDERAAAQKEYEKALNTNVPRYFDLFQNKIPQIPKYYLKISLAYLNLGSNQLGSGTSADPQGVYAIPWYSMQTTKSDTIGIADPQIRGPYGINLYNTGEKKEDGTYLYSDEEVGRWRSLPYPIKSLRFEQYNLTPSTAGDLDVGVSFGASSDDPATGGADPYFNFGSNQLVNIPIFKQANVVYDSNSVISPQDKNATVFVGLDDYKKSETYNSNTRNPPEMITPQPDSIYPIVASWAWFNSMENDNFFPQALQGLYYTRSFNGFGQFEINKDSRGPNNPQWNDQFFSMYGAGGRLNGNVATWKTPSLPRSWKDVTPYEFFGGKFSNTAGNYLKFTLPSGSYPEFSGAYYKNWTLLRTFILTSKTFWKTSYHNKWNDAANIIDGNLFWDTNLSDGPDANTWKSPWSGAQGSETTSPNQNKGTGVGRGTWFFLSQVGGSKGEEYRTRLYPAGSIVSTGYCTLFSGYNCNTNGSYILGIAKPSRFSNLHGSSDYGVSQSTPTPFTEGLKVNAPGYNYDANYQIVDTIQSNFKDDSNFATSLADTSFDLGAKYKKAGHPVFAQNVTVDDIKKGEGTFWKSDSQFDKAYMETLSPSKMKISYDDQNGSLTYSFPVYSPGYSKLGRLFQDGDGVTENTNNDTKTLDFVVTKTITGFAKANLQMKQATGNAFNDVPLKSEQIVNNVWSQKAPTAFLSFATANPALLKTNGDQVTLKTKIAEQFQTTYLGNVTNAQDNQTQTEQTLNPKYLRITNINNSDGTISFQINVPDYVFRNNNRQVFPLEYKQLTFTWTGLPVPKITIKGTNVSQTPGIDFEVFNINTFASFKNKAASEITANAITSSNVITTSRADYATVQANPSTYIDLNPDDASGKLIWTLRFPGDDNVRFDGLLPLTVVVEWMGFSNTNTLIKWKTNIDSLGVGKTPKELLEAIQAHPENYLDVTNGRRNQGTQPFSAADFDFSKMLAASVIDDAQGTVDVSGIGLKNYYRNGAWITNGAVIPGGTPRYLAVPHRVLQAQKPYNVAVFAADTLSDGHAKIWQSITPFYEKNPNDDSPTTNADLVKQLSTSEIKQLMVKNGISPLNNVLKITTNPVISNTLQTPISNLVYKNNELQQSLVADPLKGTLVFQDLSVKNWINKGSNTPEALHKLSGQTYKFPKLTNTWKWSNQLPLEAASLSPLALFSDLQDPVAANQLLDDFNIGQKYYDNDGVLKNTYVINPQLVELNPYLGTLTFQANAIQVTNWATDGVVSGSNHYVSEPKSYSLINRLETQYEANANLTKGVNASISGWVKVVKADSYENASPQKQAAYLNEYNALQSPNYTNVDALEGISLTQQYLKNHHLDKIKASDLAIINNLKSSSAELKDTDFTDYFYVPQFLLFLASPQTTASTATDRTFAIAKAMKTTPFSSTAMELDDIYIVNYYKDANKSLRKIPNVLFNDFLRGVSFVNFHSNPNNANANALAVGWNDLTPSQIKEQLDYLTANRDNLAIRNGLHYKQIQAQWISTFVARNIPFEGIKDPTIIYPLNVVANDYQRTLTVNSLLFSYYSQSTTPNNPSSIVQNHTLNNQQVWITNVGVDSWIEQILSSNDTRFSKIPSAFLTDLGLSQGVQANPANTWNQLFTQMIYTLNGSLAPINQGGEETLLKIPAVTVGNISVNDQAGTITFANVQGTDVWVNGKQSSKDFGTLVLDLGLHSSRLIKNPAHTALAWLVSQTSETNSISTRLIEFNKKIVDESFSLEKFNQMLNNIEAFFAVSNPGDTKNTKVAVAPGFKPADAFHLDMITGTIIFTNLVILNGYFNNVITPSQNVTDDLAFNLGWDYSTNFEQQFQDLLVKKKLLNSNTDHAAAVLNHEPQVLLHYLNVKELAGQMENVAVNVSSNPLLGQLTFNVHFKNYFKNGVNLGARNFNYNFEDFQQTLPTIIGGVAGGIGAILLSLIIWYVHNRIKNRDKLMIKTNKKEKTSK